MPITMSVATIEDDSRQALLGSEIDSSFAGGVKANTETTGHLWWKGTEKTGVSLAGVTASFATNVSNAIDSYKSSVNTCLDQLQDANSQVAFKGESVKAALTTFIDSVRSVAKSYLDKLTVAENQIIASVDKAYKTQDTDLSSDLKSDSNSLDPKVTLGGTILRAGVLGDRIAKSVKNANNSVSDKL